MNKKIVIIQRSTPEYRFRFFELLKTELASRQIQLDLVYGEGQDNLKNDFKQISWARYKKNRHFKLGKYIMVWQQVLPEIREADLVIVNQHNLQLVNYLLMLARLFSRRRKIAFWDHGRNMQSNKNSIANRLKRLYTRHCDWWFAYTNGVKKLLIEKGYPAGRITVVENSIDTNENVRLYHSIGVDEASTLRKKYGIRQDNVVGIYCGALYKEKRIEFLLHAGEIMWKNNPQFRLLVVGNGPDRHIIEHALQEKPWLIWAGSQFGRNKALHFKISDFFLLPGAIGLAVLDSFTFQTPIITTQYEFHGPEFEYLENEINGIITKNTLSDYVSAVNELIQDSKKLTLLKQNCLNYANRYTVEHMVKNFSHGVVEALR